LDVKKRARMLNSHCSMTMLMKAQFQLRYCPALAKKPTDNKSPPKKDAKPRFDPFANPPPALHIANIPSKSPTHCLVLNKFPVIPEHFILATLEDKPQTDLLEPDDLFATYGCLHAWEAEAGHEERPGDSRLFAFFNSGEHSGASQPHRHLQMLPVSSMGVGLSTDAAASWTLLIDTLDQPLETDTHFPIHHNPDLPFLALSTPLSADLSASELYGRYVYLLRIATYLSNGGRLSESSGLHVTNTYITDLPGSRRVAISYNLALTTFRMAVCPRLAEGAPVQGLDGQQVALNGTILGGTALAKDHVVWDALRAEQKTTERQALQKILTAIGSPPLPGHGGGAGDQKL
jgi:sulfate adenylyltransferase (ADP) / ATP adenylyltransferase